MPVQPLTIKPYGSYTINSHRQPADAYVCRDVDGSIERGMLLLCVGVWVRARPNEQTNVAEDGRSHDDGQQNSDTTSNAFRSSERAVSVE